MRRLGMVIATLLFSATPMRGQGWVQISPGVFGYEFDLVTSGVFRCAIAAPQSMCQNGALPGTIVLSSGGGTMTLGYTGLSTLLTATNVGQRAALGSITRSITGPFTIPYLRNTMLFTFQISLTETAPLTGTDYWLSGYRPTGAPPFQRNCCDGYGKTYAYVPSELAPPPFPPFTYSAVAFDYFLGTSFDASEGDVQVTALYGLAPEPATFALLAPALIGVGWWRRRRAA